MAATSSVFLNVKDIQKSLAFYKALGFRVAKEWKDEETGKVAYADLSLQGADFGIGDVASNDDPEFQKWVSTPLGAGVMVNFTVGNVDRFYENAQKSGATVEMPITDRPYGRMFIVNDPDGYTISFMTEPKKRAVAKKAVKKVAKKAKKAVAKASAKKAPAKKAKKAAPRRR